MTMTIQEQIEKAAEEKCDQDSGICEESFLVGAETAIKFLTEMLCKFDEKLKEEIYRWFAPYDQDKEKNFIKGARWQHKQSQLTILALREELARLKGGGK